MKLQDFDTSHLRRAAVSAHLDRVNPHAGKPAEPSILEHILSLQDELAKGLAAILQGLDDLEGKLTGGSPPIETLQAGAVFPPSGMLGAVYHTTLSNTNKAHLAVMRLSTLNRL